MADSKHQQLVTSIAEGVAATLDPRFKDLSEQFASEIAIINTLLAALVARMEVLEVSSPSTGKRTARVGKTGGGAATATATTAAGATDAADAGSTVKNAMLYARWAAHALAPFREKFFSEESTIAFAADEKLSAIPEGTEKRFLAEGSFFWKKLATPQQKTEIRDEFKRWKEGNSRVDLAEPLGADGGEPDDGPE